MSNNEVTQPIQNTVAPSDFYKPVAEDLAQENHDKKAESAASDDASAKASLAKPGEELPSDIKLSIPENYNLTQSRLDDIVAFAKEHKIDGVTAQKILDSENKAVAGLIKAQDDDYDALVDKFIEAGRNDKEIGGTNYEETVFQADKALAVYGSPELKTLLEDTKYKEHPELLRMLSKIGKAMGSGPLIKGGQNSAPVEKQMYEHFYKTKTME